MMKTLLYLVAGIVIASPAWAAPDERAVLAHYADLA
jgi:hypothetical protein